MDDLKPQMKEDLLRKKEELHKKTDELTQEIALKKKRISELFDEMKNDIFEKSKRASDFRKAQFKALSPKALSAHTECCRLERKKRPFLKWLFCFCILLGLTIGFQEVLLQWIPLKKWLIFGIFAVAEIFVALFAVRVWNAPGQKRIDALLDLPELKEYNESIRRFYEEEDQAVQKKHEAIEAEQANLKKEIKQAENEIEQVAKEIESVENRIFGLSHPNTLYVFVGDKGSVYSIYIDGVLYQRSNGGRVIVSIVERGLHALRVVEEYNTTEHHHTLERGTLQFKADDDAHLFAVGTALERMSVTGFKALVSKKIKNFTLE